MPVRFLHAADLHLGMRITRLGDDAAVRIPEARFLALESLANQAQQLNVDFVVIAGDIFDDNNVDQSLSGRVFAFLEGSTWPGPVFIIPGNHDPLTPGCVWDRDPWTRAQPHKRVRVLRESAAVAIAELGVTLFPCPLRSRTSIEDPTQWIARHPRESDAGFRIGIAHGSLKILPQLPEDDHLIPADAAQKLGLDYLALGHWHKKLVHGDRSAYPGTHEPMHFPNETTGESTGWAPYSDDGDNERFADNGVGNALLVQIAGPGAMPTLTDVNVGRLQWLSESIDVTGRGIGELESDYGRRPQFGQTVLKLRLSGQFDQHGFRRLDEFRDIILGRFHPGSQFDAEAVSLRPEADAVRAAVGEGVLARVLERLQAEAESSDASTQETARQALKHLFHLAFEDQPA